MFYCGVDSAVDAQRVSDRIMGVKVEIRGVVFSVICAYAPQVGCHLEERGEFWSKLDQVAESVPKGGERRTEFTGHVDEGKRGDEEVLSRNGIKECRRKDGAGRGEHFKKREDHS